jgi:hypothetical protein
MASSGGAMLTREEESNAEVRHEDQENINTFGRLNARLHDCRCELAVLRVRNCAWCMVFVDAFD